MTLGTSAYQRSDSLGIIKIKNNSYANLNNSGNNCSRIYPRARDNRKRADDRNHQCWYERNHVHDEYRDGSDGSEQ